MHTYSIYNLSPWIEEIGIYAFNNQIPQRSTNYNHTQPHPQIITRHILLLWLSFLIVIHIKQG